MKKLILILLLNLSSLGYASTLPVSVTTLPKTKIANSGQKLLSFLFYADSGIIKKIDKNQYTLVLHNPSSTVSFYTNTPRYIVGTMDLNYFLKRWQKPAPHDYTTTPPNMALSYLNKQGNYQTLVAQFASPELINNSKQLKFTLKAVDKNYFNPPEVMGHVVISFASPAICGLLGSWGNLPGETQYNTDCHKVLY